MELPPKPKLDYRERNGTYGELIRELTPESEIVWSRYLTELHLAKAAIWLENNQGK